MLKSLYDYHENNGHFHTFETLGGRSVWGKNYGLLCKSTLPFFTDWDNNVIMMCLFKHLTATIAHNYSSVTTTDIQREKGTLRHVPHIIITLWLFLLPSGWWYPVMLFVFKWFSLVEREKRMDLNYSRIWSRNR